MDSDWQEVGPSIFDKYLFIDIFLSRAALYYNTQYGYQKDP